MGLVQAPAREPPCWTIIQRVAVIFQAVSLECFLAAGTGTIRTEGADVRQADYCVLELDREGVGIALVLFDTAAVHEPAKSLGPKGLEVQSSDIGVDGTFSDFADAVDGFRAGAPADERVMCGATGEAKRESMFGFHVALVEDVEQQLCREVDDVQSGHDE